MGQQLPPNLVPFFTRALKAFQLSKSNFKVLCTLPPPPPPGSSGESSLESEPAARPPSQNSGGCPPPQTLLVLDSSFNPPTLAHQAMALSALLQQQQQQQQQQDQDGSREKKGAAAPSSRVLLLLAINNADKAPKPAAFPQRLAMMYVFALDLLSALSSREEGGGARRQDANATTTTTTTTGTTCPVGGVEIDLAVTTEPYFHSKSGAIAADPFYYTSSSSSSATTTTTTTMEQVYLTGFDTLIRIFDGKYYPDGSMRAVLDPFLARSRLRVTTRPDADWGGTAEQRAYLDDLRGGRLEAAAGGRREWADRVEMVDCSSSDGDGNSGDAVISSTKVRGAVQSENWEMLGEFVSSGVADWIRREELFREA
ncbi:hypothetical protein G7054_g7268 [Neopestalotiopsis clavispora]|nr:hypothetical protein G7054_g7268 [Neopestalotiopsis clavispora]